MSIKVSGGGGGTSYPGVTADGDTPGGLIIAGEVFCNGTSGVGEFETRPGGGIRILKGDDNNYGLNIGLSPGASGGEVQMAQEGGASVWTIDADGTEHLAGSLGINGHAVPGYPVLATGAAHTVDDVITLLQSYGFCKQS